MLTTPSTPTATTSESYTNASRQRNPRSPPRRLRPSAPGPGPATALFAAKSNTPKSNAKPSKKELVRSSYQKHTRKTPPAAPPSGRRAKHASPNRRL